MNSHHVFGLVQVIVVIALVVVAAALATPKNKVPLALRGLMKILKKDRTGRALTPSTETGSDAGREGMPGTGDVPAWKRLLAFILVLVAFAIALIIV